MSGEEGFLDGRKDMIKDLGYRESQEAQRKASSVLA
jgi:hypothetical protein